MPIVFDPSKIAPGGVLSYPTPTAVPIGSWQDLVNMRMDDLSLRSRPGIYEETTTVPDVVVGGGQNDAVGFYGGMLFRRNRSGDYAAIVFLDVGAGVVKMHWNTYNGSAWAGWTQESATWSVTTDGYFSIAMVPNGFGGFDGFYVQNGVDSPKFVYIGAWPTLVTTTVNAVAPPQNASSYAPVFKPSAFISVKGGTFAAPTTSVSLTPAASGAAPAQVITVTSGAAITDGHVGSIQLSSGSADFSSGQQCWIAASIPDDTWLTCVKWSLIEDSAGNLSINDPENRQISLVKTDIDNGAGASLYAFAIGEHQRLDMTDMIGLHWEVIDARLTINSVMTIYGIMCGGNVPGMAQHACSFQCANTLTESPGKVFRPVGAGAGLTTEVRLTDQSDTLEFWEDNTLPLGYGAPLTFYGCSTPADCLLPIHPSLSYVADTPVFATTEAENTNSVFTYRIYRKDPGEKDFYHVKDVTVGAAGVTDNTLFGGTDTWEKRALSEDNTAPEDKDRDVRLPDGYTLPMQKGRAMAWANDKLYVVGASGTGASLRDNTVYESEKSLPGRYRATPRYIDQQIDPDSGKSYVLENENGKAILAGSSSLVGGNVVYVWSDRGFYGIDGFTAVKIASCGCIGPTAFAEQDGTVYFIDSDMVLRSYRSRAEDVSRYTFHDKLTSVPAARRGFVSMAVHQGRLFVSRASASSNENHRILAWNPRMGMLESDDSVPVALPCSLFINWVYGSEGKLMFFTKTGQLWQYDREGTIDDDGTDITCSGVTPGYCADWENLWIGQAKVVCTDQAGKTMTVTRTGLRSGATSAGTINLDSADSVTWRGDFDAAGARPGLSDAAVEVSFSAAVKHPFVIQAFKLEDKTDAGIGAN